MTAHYKMVDGRLEEMGEREYAELAERAAKLSSQPPPPVDTVNARLDALEAMIKQLLEAQTAPRKGGKHE